MKWLILLDSLKFSSGKMGFAIAEAASKLGADVFSDRTHQLKTDDISIKVCHISWWDVRSMLEALCQIDICIMNAAVSDYKPLKKIDKKLKKGNWFVERS